MHRLFIAFTFVALPIATVLAQAQPGARAESGIDVAVLDKSADPCVDFYAYACGGWTKNEAIPADRSSWGVAERLQEQNETRLRTILEAASKSADSDSRKIGDHFATCMDEAAINTKAAVPLEPSLKKIAALSSVRGLAPLVGELQSIGVNVFFGFGAEADFKDASLVRAIADQGGLGLPDRDYYFRDDAKSVELRQQYVAHVGRMLALIGVKSGADAVMRIETALAKNALDAVHRRDPAAIYHKLTPAELQALTPAFDWTAYFTSAGAPPIDALNVTEPDFFKGLNTVLAETAIDDLKTYLRWHLVHASAAVLSEPFVKENFAFYGTTLTGAKELRPRWKRCVRVHRRRPRRSAREGVRERRVRSGGEGRHAEDGARAGSSLEDDIKELSWMTDATRAQAVVKLHAIANKIGYPDTWRDYSALSIVRGDALGNSQRANAFEFHRQMRRIGKPLDKSEWDMTPPTVNAYYNPLQNNVNFPAGILQPPFYNPKADPAVNYGGAGAVIGHELTHGFDDEGRQFDASGNLKDWWTEADTKAFDARAQCFVEQYSGYTAVDDVKVNGS